MKLQQTKRARPLTALFAALCIAVVNPACAEKPATQKNTPAKAAGKAQTTEEQKPAAATTAPAPDANEQPPQQNEAVTAAADKKAETKVDVYLFHGTYRCHSCNLMEELTVEAIDENLADEKKTGRVQFHHINVEEDQNRHFIQDYRISAISIILSQKSGGKEQQWKNLDQVWMLLRNREKFKEYVLKEIRGYLK